jgi:acyl-CoA thioester hydrolase
MPVSPFPVDEITMRVRYAETDQMGVVYYANYLVWFEVARTEYFRRRGVRYSDLEHKGVYLMVAESHCRYKASVRYDDQVRIATRVTYVKASSLEFEYEIFMDQKLIATGSTIHVFVNQERKPVKIPAEVTDALTRHEVSGIKGQPNDRA